MSNVLTNASIRRPYCHNLHMNAVVLQTAEEGRDLRGRQGGLMRDHRAVQVDQRGADAVALQDLGRDVVYRVENVIGYEFAHSYTLSERTEKDRSGFLHKLDSIGGIDNFKSKLEILCKGLVEKYPTAKIFFFTRWNCKDFKGSDSEKVIDAMVEVCGNYSIPIFDCARKGGIYADNDAFRKIYFQGEKDTAHLNAKGHARFLKVAENFILQY